ncbi:MAG: hypothetical protein ABSD67_25095 [Terracidiphilus sp.]
MVVRAGGVEGATGDNAQDGEDGEDVNGGADTGAAAADEIVGRRGEMKQAEQRERPAGGAGQVELREDQKKDQERNCFCGISFIEYGHGHLLCVGFSVAAVALVGPEEEDDSQAEQKPAQGIHDAGTEMFEGPAEEKEQVGRYERKLPGDKDAAGFGFETATICEAHEFFS